MVRKFVLLTCMFPNAEAHWPCAVSQFEVQERDVAKLLGLDADRFDRLTPVGRQHAMLKRFCGGAPEEAMAEAELLRQAN